MRTYREWTGVRVEQQHNQRQEGGGSCRARAHVQDRSVRRDCDVARREEPRGRERAVAEARADLDIKRRRTVSRDSYETRPIRFYWCTTSQPLLTGHTGSLVSSIPPPDTSADSSREARKKSSRAMAPLALSRPRHAPGVTVASNRRKRADPHAPRDPSIRADLVAEREAGDRRHAAARGIEPPHL